MVLPNFLCVGASKAGTTSVYDILIQHPDIFLSDFKEPHFFNVDENYQKGLAWYEKEYFASYAGQKAIGEFTPTYLYVDSTPERILDSLGPEVKLLFILRNPVDRAYSHYMHSVRDEREKLNFIDALAHEDERIKNAKTIYEKIVFSYIGQSLYAHEVKNYLKYFPKENMKFIIFESDFVRNRQKTINDLLSFINVPIIELDMDVKSNPTSSPRLKILKRFFHKAGIISDFAKTIIPSSKFRQKIRNKIEELNNKPITTSVKLDKETKLTVTNKYFIDDIKELESMLDKDLSLWYNYE